MDINIKHEDNLIIALKGRLDTVASNCLLEAFAKEQVKEDLVIVDMKELEYISSAGLRALLAIKKELVANKKQLEIHNLNAVCTEVFKVTGFNNILTVK